jgi:photosystem II stability/assembly factor-like uncharacterized protein
MYSFNYRHIGALTRSLFVVGMMLVALLVPNLAGAPAGSSASADEPAVVHRSSGTTTLQNLIPVPVHDSSATYVGRFDAHQMLRLTLGLQPPRMAEEEQFLRDVQTKNSPFFHRFLTADQWNARFAPSAQDEQAVVDWANAAGLTVTQRWPNRLTIEVAAPVSTIEAALHLQINTYRRNSDTFWSNDRDPVIPGNLAGILHVILGLNSLEVAHSYAKGGPRSTNPSTLYSAGPVVQQAGSWHSTDSTRQRPAAQNGVGPRITNNNYDPSDIYSSQAYNWTALMALGRCCNPVGISFDSPPEASIAIATGGAAALSDLQGFANQFPPMYFNYTLINVNGNPGCCGLESTLDLEWSTAMSNPKSTCFFCAPAHIYMFAAPTTLNSKGNPTLSSQNMLSLAQAALNDGRARIFSQSWGTAESNYNQPSIDQFHAVYDSMVGQGWTLTSATGDNGTTDACSSAGSVDYPASDPDMVAAGGTTAQFAGTFSSETAWNGTGCDPNNTSNNNGGGGGGCSNHFAIPFYQAIPYCAGNRAVPDVALNASVGQNIYYNGGLTGTGGTSIVAPELAGFFAQENAYLLSEGNICGAGSSPCAPMGNANVPIYNAGLGNGVGLPPHAPFYDVTSGCTGGSFGAVGYCATGGYDLATGFGSFNALQLAWAINWQLFADSGAPSVSFSGPATNHWYNTDQTINWNVTDSGGCCTPSGVAGYSYAWDRDPGDVGGHATPGCCDSFYTGPQVPNGVVGSLNLLGAGSQGCHTVHVRAWDNMGLGSGDQTYGPLCYDTNPPTTFSALSPAANGAGWNNSAVQVTLSAFDFPIGPNSSGLNATYYTIDSQLCGLPPLVFFCSYTSPLNISGEGQHTVLFYSTDNAGNSEAIESAAVNIDLTPPHTAASLSGTQNGGVYSSPVQVTLTPGDNLSGVANTVYQIDGGTLQAYTGPFSVSGNGSHAVTFHSTDNAGNAESSQSASFTINIPATFTPTPTQTRTSTPTSTPTATRTSMPTNTPTVGAGSWVSQSSGTTNTLKGASCASATACEVVGANGTSLGTTSGGSPWSAQVAGTSSWLYGVACPSSSVCFAVGSGGAIRATTNGGTNWAGQTSGTANRLRGIACPSVAICYAVGDGGTILSTSDGGATWSPQASGVASILYGIACPSATTCYVVGDGGVIRATTNGGSTWNAQASGIATALFGIACPATKTCYAVGSGGVIRATTTGGGAWGGQSSGTGSNLNGVSCPGATSCTAVGNGGTIVATSNGGATWSAQAGGSANNLNAVSCPGVATCYAVGDGGTILKHAGGASPTSTPTGTAVPPTATPTRTALPATATPTGTAPSPTATPNASWAQQTSGISTSLKGVSCPDTAHCTAVGAAGAILNTTNGGATWSAQSSGTTRTLNAVNCPSASVCEAVGAGGTIVGTANGGATWAAQTSGTANSLRGVGCVSATTCEADGDGGVIVGTTNGGATWAAQAGGTATNLNGLGCVGSTTCEAVGASGTILGTTNTGGTWAAQTSGTTHSLYAVKCATPSVCWAVGFGGTIVATTNGGGTWSAQASGTANQLNGVNCSGSNVCAAVGAGGTIVATGDGATWGKQASGTANGLNGVRCASTTICFAVGDNGTIFRRG